MPINVYCILDVPQPLPDYQPLFNQNNHLINAIWGPPWLPNEKSWSLFYLHAEDYSEETLCGPHGFSCVTHRHCLAIGTGYGSWRTYFSDPQFQRATRATMRLFAQLTGATRLIFLSDIIYFEPDFAANFDEPFDVLLQRLQAYAIPTVWSPPHEVNEGYFNRYFVEDIVTMPPIEPPPLREPIS